MRSGHAGPVTMGRITRGPPCWTRPWDGTTSSQAFVRRRVGRRVSLPVVLSSLVQRGWRRHRAKGGVFAFAPTSGVAFPKTRRWRVRVDPLWCTEHCPVAHRTVRCARPGQPSVSFAPFLLNPFLDFLLVCVEPLAPVELII
jgi:hypothetical protein